ncbi:hypothetical protein OFY82_004386 [Salmonella enterica]|nr:hypothetical protein [Salmonella enterica]EKP2024918.1 hypothetical protein [Salmonella enterica]EKP2052656.1 hypothetical protein [Salmonella enterica]
MSKKMIEEMYVDIKYLQHKVTVLEKFIHILMVMIPPEKREAINSLTSAYQLNIATLEENGNAIAKGMEVVKAFPDALGEDPNLAALSLLSGAFLVLNETEERREAMKTWLGIASVDELANDLQQALRLKQDGMPSQDRDLDDSENEK